MPDLQALAHGALRVHVCSVANTADHSKDGSPVGEHKQGKCPFAVAHAPGMLPILAVLSRHAQADQTFVLSASTIPVSGAWMPAWPRGPPGLTLTV